MFPPEREHRNKKKIKNISSRKSHNSRNYYRKKSRKRIGAHFNTNFAEKSNKSQPFYKTLQEAENILGEGNVKVCGLKSSIC